jgi:hypothetical protein
MSETLVFNFLGLALTAIAIVLAVMAVADGRRHRHYNRAVTSAKFKRRGH